MKLPRRRMTASIPSLAMGDIAFLLLIFFVILARAQDDTHLQWEPAPAEDLERVGQARVSIVVDVENKTYLNGREIAVSALAPALDDLLGDTPPGRRTVLLKVHQEATAPYFEPVIEAVSQVGGDLYHILEPADAGRQSATR